MFYGAIGAIAMLQTASALPVGFKDSWMTMGEVSKDYSEVNGIYTFAQNSAVGAAVMTIKVPSGMPKIATGVRIDIADVHLTHRLARWNMPEAQANVYIGGDLGQLRRSDRSGAKSLQAASLQADYETRRIYTAYKWHGTRTSDLRFYRDSLAAGFSFYATEYDEWQPWLVFEASRQGGDLKEQSTYAPYLRFIHKTLFIELGAAQKAGKFEGLKMNFRYTF